MRIQIKTLGFLEIRSDLQEMTGFLDQPVRTALLIHLAVEREVTREGVMGLLWPDHDPDRARHTLNQTLYRLRKDLGQDWLDAKGERLRTTESVSVDVHSFQGAVEGGDIPTALTEYRGPFLAGWRFPGTGHFESWVDRVRIQLSRQFREANRHHVTELREAGELARALAVADGWVEADPLDDEAQHCLLELLVETGDRAEALSRFDAYERLLSLDDLTPLDNTLALVESVRRKEDHSVPSESELQDAKVPLWEAPGIGGSKQPEDGVPALAPRPGVESGVSKMRRRWWGVRGAFTVAIIVLLLSAAGLWVSRQLSRSPPLVATRVLVVPLENQTGDDDLDPVGRLAADWISQGLSGAGFVEVVPSIEVIPKLRREQGESSTDAFGHALDFARENQAGTVVYGTYYRREEGLEFHVQVAAVATRKLLQTIGPVTSHSEDPMEAVDILRERAMIALAVHFDERLEGMLEKSTLPPSYESYLAYVEGFELFGRGRGAEVIPLMELSNELSPGFTAPLILAGFAHANSGDYLVAESLVAVVNASAGSLTPYDRYRLDFLESILRGDREGSLRATRAAAALQPGGTAHAAAGTQALSLNRPREALDILATFNRDGIVGQVYTPLWNTITTAHHSLGEHRQELEEAERGRRAQPFSLRTLFYEIRALAALGRVDQVAERLDECVNFPQAQRSWTPAGVMLSAARELRVHGHADASSRAVEKALAWYAGRPGEEQRSGPHRRGLAQTLSVAERWEDARVIYEELEAGSPDRVEYVGNLGVLAARLGDPDRARLYDRRLASLESPYLFGRHTLWRARIAAQLGDLEASLGLLRNAFGEGAAFSFDLLHTEADLDPLRAHPAFLEILRPKG